MISIDFELNLTEQDLIEGFQSRLDRAMDQTALDTSNEARRIAGDRLSSGKPLWDNGFSMNRISDGYWVISLTGKLANLMEDGIKVDELREMILKGNRATFNKAQGKNYVDVPIGLDADSVSGSIGKTSVNISQFKSADEVIKSVTMSNWKKGGVEEKNKAVSRIKGLLKGKKTDVLKSRDLGSNKSSFLTIKRVSPNMKKPFPSSPFKGARVLDSLDNFIEKSFTEALGRFL